MISFRYRDKGSAVHQVNPFSKLAWGVSILVLALLFDNPLYLLLLLLSTLPLVMAGKVWREWASLMKLSLYLALLIIVINALVSYEGSHVLYQFSFKLPLLGTPRITFEAIIFGIGNALRLLAIMSAFAVIEKRGYILSRQISVQKTGRMLKRPSTTQTETASRF